MLICIIDCTKYTFISPWLLTNWKKLEPILTTGSFSVSIKMVLFFTKKISIFILHRYFFCCMWFKKLNYTSKKFGEQWRMSSTPWSQVDKGWIQFFDFVKFPWNLKKNLLSTRSNLTLPIKPPVKGHVS